MKIGIDIRSLQNDSSQRGIGSYTRELVKGMLRYFPEHEYVFFAFANRPLPCLADGDAIGDARFSRVTSRKKRFVWILGQILFPVAAGRERLDIFYSPEYIVPVLAPCAKVITVHDFINIDYPEYIKRCGMLRKFYYYLKDRTLENADGVIAVSEYTGRKIAEFTRVKPSRVSVIHEAAGEEFRVCRDAKLLDGVRGKYGLDDDFLLYVGAIDHHKNIERLVTAFASSGARGRLALAGVQPDPVYTGRVRERCRELGVESRVGFLGYVPQKDLVGLYNAARAFISVSEYEGFGLPLLEAMSCGTPVIFADNTSMPEIAGGAGLGVDPRSADRIGDAIGRLWRDPALREELSTKALARAKRFSWETACRQTMSLFKELAR